MHCELVQNILEEYLAGELDDALKREVESHIQKCSSCQHELDLTENIAQVIRMIPDPEVPQSIFDNVLAEVQASQKQAETGFTRIIDGFRSGIKHIKNSFTMRRWQVVTATVTILLLFGIWGGFYLRHRTNVIQQPYVEETEITSQQVAQAVEDIKFALSIVNIATKKTEITLAKLPSEMGIGIARQKAFNTLQEVDTKTSEKVLDAIRRGLSVLTKSEGLPEIQTINLNGG